MPPPGADVPARRWVCRQGRVVESGGIPVVRFAPECGLSSDGCAGHCGWRRPTAQIPVAWLDLPDEAEYGDRVSLAVAAGPLTWLAVRIFAVPLAALLTGAWLGEAIAVRLALSPDLLSGVLGVACLLAALGLVVRQGGALGRMLELTACLERTDL